MYGKMETLGRSMGVKTNIIWGCLWDETLQWLVESGSKTYAEIKNSTSWGNYKDSTFKYEDTNGIEATKNTLNSTKIPTGSSEYTKANNIYDMAGNVYDWTLETDGSRFITFRGGYYSDNGSSIAAFSRIYGKVPSSKDYDLGFRTYLYIK